MRVMIGVTGGGVLRRNGFWARLFRRRKSAIVVLHGNLPPEPMGTLSPLDEEVRSLFHGEVRLRVPQGNYPSVRAAYARGELIAKSIDRSTDPPTIIFESAG